MQNGKMWIYNTIEESEVEKLKKETGLSRILTKVLVSRGIKDAAAAKRFIDPEIKDLYNPFLMKDMEKATDRIIKAIEEKEKIVIFGDYDVDGTTATAILFDFICKLGGNADYYIPDRLEEGYGLSIEALKFILNQGCDLIITVDCGITAFDETSFAKANNIDLIITDHHECKSNLPEAYAIIDPKRHDCSYPFKELAGVGVAFKLINAISSKTGLRFEELRLKYLDLVALGTIADIVPLKDENRIIAKHGIAMILDTKNLGLRALIEKAGLAKKPVGSYEIGYIIGPRINAIGRMGDAKEAVRLFITNDENEALNISQKLEEANTLRQGIEQTIFDEAVKLIEMEINLEEEKFIVLAQEGWHHGVIGIVASRITEKFCRPCILISIEGDEGIGSGRSIEGFNLFNALKACEDLLEKYGGHELAAGLRIKKDNIDEFRNAINRYANDLLTDEIMTQKIRIDAYLDGKDEMGDIDSIQELELMSPFGQGNPMPIFVVGNAIVNEIRNVGTDFKHLKLKLECKGVKLDAIGFNLGGENGSIKIDDSLDVVAKLEINYWNSTSNVQLNIKDIRKNYNTRDFYLSLDRCIEAEFTHMEYGSANDGFKNNEIDLSCKNRGETNTAKNSLSDPVSNSIADLVKEIKVELGYDFKNINKLYNEQELLRELEKSNNNGEKIVIFAKSTTIVEELEMFFKSGILKGIKNYRVCYSYFNNFNNINGEDDKLTLLINPLYEYIDCKAYNTAVFAGVWTTPFCMLKMLEKAIKEDKKILFYKTKEKRYPEIEEIIPEREDIANIYRYTRAKCKNGLVVNDLFAFASEVSKVYNLTMNYIKLRRGLYILSELNLLKVIPSDKNGVILKHEPEKIRKVKLEDSVIFNKMQRLKD